MMFVTIKAGSTVHGKKYARDTATAFDPDETALQMVDQGVARKARVRVKRTPGGLHLYTARIKDEPRYGWGDTPAAARAKLAEVLTREEDRS